MKRRTLGTLAVASALGIGWAFVPGTMAQEKAKEKRSLTFEIYKDAKEEFRWRLKAGNGQNIASSGQGYKAKADAEKAIETIKQGAAKAKVKDVTDAPADK